MTGEDRDSSEVQLPPSPLKTVLRWVGVLAALATLAGYGIWVGSIQTKIGDLEDDVNENEGLIKANTKLLNDAETRERDRFERLLSAIRQEMQIEKDEIWELKRAIALVRLELRYRHGERAPEITLPEAPSVGVGGGAGSGYGRGHGHLANLMKVPPGADPGKRPRGDRVFTTDEGHEESAPPKAKTPRRRRPTRAEVAKVADEADEALEDMAEESEDPLANFSF